MQAWVEGRELLGAWQAVKRGDTTLLERCAVLASHCATLRHWCLLSYCTLVAKASTQR